MTLDIITTITGPATTYDLTNLAAVKDELSILGDTANDAFLGRAIAQASAAISQYCNRTFVSEQVRDVIRCSGSVKQLPLSRFPMITLVSATAADGAGGQTALVLDTDFLLDKARGWLIRIGSGGATIPWYTATTTVTYQAGYPIIPADIQEAALRLITQRFRSRGRDPMVRSQSQPGLGDQTFWVGSAPGVKGPFTEEVAGLLEKYVVPMVG